VSSISMAVQLLFPVYCKLLVKFQNVGWQNQVSCWDSRFFLPNKSNLYDQSSMEILACVRIEAKLGLAGSDCRLRCSASKRKWMMS
jgi:hypothetical protein